MPLSLLVKKQPDEPRLENLKYHIAHSHHQINLIYRRVIEHEQIPHNEKAFILTGICKFVLPVGKGGYADVL